MWAWRTFLPQGPIRASTACRTRAPVPKQTASSLTQDHPFSRRRRSQTRNRARTRTPVPKYIASLLVQGHPFSSRRRSQTRNRARTRTPVPKYMAPPLHTGLSLFESSPVTNQESCPHSHASAKINSFCPCSGPSLFESPPGTN